MLVNFLRDDEKVKRINLLSLFIKLKQGNSCSLIVNNLIAH